MTDSQHKLHYDGCNITVDDKSWTTKKSIVDAVVKNDVVMLIYDAAQYPDNKVARNLEGFNVKGEHLWLAENPTDTPNEAYVEFLNDEDVLENTVAVSDMAGFRCAIDINSGTLVNVVYSD